MAELKRMSFRCRRKLSEGGGRKVPKEEENRKGLGGKVFQESD